MDLGCPVTLQKGTSLLRLKAFFISTASNAKLSFIYLKMFSIPLLNEQLSDSFFFTYSATHFIFNLLCFALLFSIPFALAPSILLVQNHNLDNSFGKYTAASRLISSLIDVGAWLIPKLIVVSCLSYTLVLWKTDWMWLKILKYMTGKLMKLWTR